MSQTILLSIDLRLFNTKPEKREQMGILCVTACVPFVRVSLSSQIGAASERFSLLITLPSLHLSVRRPELMGLSADGQTACCQLRSVQPDNTAQCTSGLFPRNGRLDC